MKTIFTTLCNAYIVLFIVYSFPCQATISSDKDQDKNINLKLIPLDNTAQGIANILMTSEGNVTTLVDQTNILRHSIFPIGVLMVSNNSDAVIEIPEWVSMSWTLVVSNNNSISSRPLMAGYRCLPSANQMRKLEAFGIKCLVIGSRGVYPENYHSKQMRKAKACVFLKTKDGSIIETNPLDIWLFQDPRQN